MIIRIKHSTGYTVIDNRTLRDCRLSLEARGLLASLLSYDSKFRFYGVLLAKWNGITEKRFSKLIRELMDAGYCTRTKVNGERGRFHYDYQIYEVPPTLQKPPMVEPPVDDPQVEIDQVRSINKIRSINEERSIKSSSTTTSERKRSEVESVVSGLSTEHKQFLHEFLTLFRKFSGSPYSKKDQMVVSKLDDPLANRKYIKPFLEDRVCDQYMKDGDHSLTVFVQQLKLIKSRYTETKEAYDAAREEGERYAEVWKRERQEKNQQLLKAVLANPSDPRWYDTRGFSFDMSEVYDRIPQEILLKMVAQRDQVIAAAKDAALAKLG